MSNLEDHISALETAQRQGKLSTELASRVVALAGVIQESRVGACGALAGKGAPKPAQETRVTIPAPAILRRNAEMQAVERIEMGLINYKGDGRAAAFFGWVNPDGTVREGDFRVLETLIVDKLIHALGGPDKLVAALRCMEQGPELTLGPDYGDDRLNFIAMILAMNRTQGRTPQRKDAHVDLILEKLTLTLWTASLSLATAPL